MPRNASGTFTLAIGAFAPLGLIKSSDHNANYSDIATALTQSLATTGVSTMTGPVKAAAGGVGGPSYTFGTALQTGFWLAGANQIGWTANGVQGATFNSDLSVTWAGAASWTGNITVNGQTNLVGAVTFSATTYTFGAGAAAAFWTGIGANADVGVIFDGGGSTIVAITGAAIHIPFAMTINKWSVIGDQSGSITIDVLRANNGVPSSSIVGAGTKPNLTAQQFSGLTSPSSWTATTLAKDDYVAFQVTGSPSSVQRVEIALVCSRTGS